MVKNLSVDIRLATDFLFDLSRHYLTRPNNEIIYFNLLFSIAIAARPDVILEIGTGGGLSSRAFARALQYWQRIDHRKRHLHTCDIDGSAVERVSTRYGSLVIPHNIPSSKLAERWEQHRNPIDLLYIDAEHSYDQSMADFSSFSQWVVPNGLIIMHDTFPLSETHEDLRYSGMVWKTVREIKRRYRDDFEVSTIPYLSGISIIRRAGSKYF